jgi:hypothetical protein
MKFIHFVLFIINISIIPSFSQDYPRREYNLVRLADEVFPLQDLDLNYEDLYENLAQILANPLDLNKASAEELRSFYILKENQVRELILYRETTGPFISVYELQSLPSFDSTTLYRLMPFVQVKDEAEQMDKSLLQRIRSEENNYFILRCERTLEDRKGYLPLTDSAFRYSGSPNKLYSRFRINRIGDFSFGFTFEKDAGETLSVKLSEKKPAFDYYSFHTQVMNKGKIKNLIIGDYITQFGQGLTLGGSFGAGKGSETITTIRRSNLGFLPYTSLNEAGFFRGAAVSYKLASSFYLHGFGSRLYRDGRLAQDSSSEESMFTSSFMITGFHRTPSELAARKQIGETNYGAVLNFKKESLDAGVIFHQTRFDIPIYRNATLYNQFSFSGDENSNVGFFLNYNLDNLTFFSEVSQTLGHGRGLVIGALASLTQRLDISLLYRKFDRNFYSFYSNAVSESTLPQNESGMYWGWKYSFSKKYSLAGYVDLFRFPWLRFRGYAPSNGSEWLLRFNYQPSKSVLIFVQAREESKVRNLSNETNVYQTMLGKKRNFWINLDYSAGSQWSFKTRAQFSAYHLSNTTKGFALIQDLNLDVGKLSFTTRYALFDTDDYDNRQYVYERDVWLAFSFPGLYGVGIREYFMVQYKLSKKIDVWLRWARTRYTDRESIGSGSEQINGNTRNDIKFQARIRL